MTSRYIALFLGWLMGEAMILGIDKTNFVGAIFWTLFSLLQLKNIRNENSIR